MRAVPASIVALLAGFSKSEIERWTELVERSNIRA